MAVAFLRLRNWLVMLDSNDFDLGNALLVDRYSADAAFRGIADDPITTIEITASLPSRRSHNISRQPLRSFPMNLRRKGGQTDRESPPAIPSTRSWLPLGISLFRHSSAARRRRSTRRIFPLTVLGRSPTNSISRGYLYGAVTCLT